MNEQIEQRLDRIESILLRIADKEPEQEWYDTKAAGKLLDRSPYSVREWCRLGRVNAEKRACGRGSAKEWMISAIELRRIKSEGLLAIKASG